MKKETTKKRNTITRRDFINHTTAGTAVIAMGPVTNLVAGDTKPEKPWPAIAKAQIKDNLGKDVPFEQITPNKVNINTIKGTSYYISIH